MKVNLINGATAPEYQTKESAGFDIYANNPLPIIIPPLQRAAIPTGCVFDIDKGYELQLRARSGLAIKNGITLINGIGTVDSDFKQEVKILLVNLSDTPFTVNQGDRIAQGVLCKIHKSTPIRGVRTKNTTRDGGFGSTGV